MIRANWWAYLAVAILFSCEVNAELQQESAAKVEIPLDKVWASKMPGTIDVWKIDDTSTAREIIAIQRALSKPRVKGMEAEPAFVVCGTVKEAIHEAHAVLVEGKKSRETLPQGSEASIVFFSYEFGQYVHLKKIVRSEDEIRLKYQFVPHKSLELTVHFALIPIGKLNAGKVHVDIGQTATDEKAKGSGWTSLSAEAAACFVSKSFSFKVQ